MNNLGPVIIMLHYDWQMKICLLEEDEHWDICLYFTNQRNKTEKLDDVFCLITHNNCPKIDWDDYILENYPHYLASQIQYIKEQCQNVVQKLWKLQVFS